MRFQYVPIEQQLYSPEIGRYRSFGIAAVRLSFFRCDIPAFIPDVSTDRSLVLSLAKLFTRERLDPVHLPEVIEDFI